MAAHRMRLPLPKAWSIRLVDCQSDHLLRLMANVPNQKEIQVCQLVTLKTFPHSHLVPQCALWVQKTNARVLGKDINYSTLGLSSQLSFRSKRRSRSSGRSFEELFLGIPLAHSQRAALLPLLHLHFAHLPSLPAFLAQAPRCQLPRQGRLLRAWRQQAQRGGKTATAATSAPRAAP